MSNKNDGIKFELGGADQPFYMASSMSPLDIRGSFNIQGPQSERIMPTTILRLFKDTPSIDEISISTASGGTVYGRRNGELQKKRAEPKPELAVVTFLQLIEMIGFNVLESFHLKNQYHPDREDPWLMVITDMGYLVIGWRKRVIACEWKGMPLVRGIVTEDDVTKSESIFHAHSMEKLQVYLVELHHFYTLAKLAK